MSCISAYVREWHGKEEDATAEAFVSFLYESPVGTIEMEYRDGSGRLLAVGICDRSESSLSSVYFYFDPAVARRAWDVWGAMGDGVCAAGENCVVLPGVLGRGLRGDEVQGELWAS